MKRLLVTIAVSALALGGCGQSADRAASENDTRQDGAMVDPSSTGTGMNSNAGTGMDATGSTDLNTGAAATPQGYVTEAASSDQFEIQSSQLVLQQSSNEQVKRFAQQMLDDHRASTEKLKTASQGASLTAPRTDLTPRHQAKLDLLRQAGPNIDQVYMEQQRTAHTEAVALHEGLVGNSGAPNQLSAHARETLPRIKAHAEMLDKIKI